MSNSRQITGYNKANKTAAGHGSHGICRVIDALRSGQEQHILDLDQRNPLPLA